MSGICGSIMCSGRGYCTCYGQYHHVGVATFTPYTRPVDTTTLPSPNIQQPMRFPHKCPLCQGTTTIMEVSKNPDSTNYPTEKKCHGCNGVGIVWG